MKFGLKKKILIVTLNGTFVFNAIFFSPSLGAVTIAFLSVLETGLLLPYSDTCYQICV